MESSPTSIKATSKKDENFDPVLSLETEFHVINSVRLPDQVSSSESSDISEISKNKIKFQYRYWYTMFLTINASLGTFFVGWSVGVFDPIQKNLVCMFDWTEDEERIFFSLISASLQFGAIIGAIVSGYITKKLGRRKAYMLTNIISFIGTALTLILNEYTMIAGRFTCGLCVGLYSTVSSVYVNEFVPYEITGLCGTVYEMVYSGAIFFSYVAGFNLPEVGSPQNQWWRIMVLIPAVLNAVNMFMLLFVFKYETPKFLYLNQKNIDGAIRSLSTIYIRNEDVEIMMNDLSKLSDPKNSEIAIKDLFTKKYIIRLFTACALMVGQQIGGADVVFMYSDHIYQQIVDDPALVRTYTFYTGVSVIMAGITSMFIIEKFGRKKLFIIGETLVVLILFTISAFYYFNMISTIIIYLFILFVFLNGVSIGPISYIYSTDVLPENGVGIAVVFNYLAAFACTQSFLFFEKSFLKSSGTYGLYGCASFLILTIAVMFVKETRNKSVREIDKLFDGK